MATTPLIWNDRRVRRFKAGMPSTPEELEEYREQEKRDALSPAHNPLERGASISSWVLWSLMEWLPFKTHKEIDGIMRPSFWYSKFILFIPHTRSSQTLPPGPIALEHGRS